MSGKLVIGVPTVPRSRDYLFATLDSLIAGIPAAAWDDVEIVVFNAAAPPERHAAARALPARYPALFALGRISLLENPAGHAVLDRPTRAPEADESEARYRWRRKLVLDFVHLGRHCAARGDLYLHVEDDMLAAPRWLGDLRAWLERRFGERRDQAFLTLFTILRLPDGAEVPNRQFFSACALLFRGAELAALIDYAERHHEETTLDFLMRDWAAAEGRKIFARSPALFQHIGLLSSFDGETRPFQAASYREDLRQALRRGAGELLHMFRRSPAELIELARWRTAVLVPPLVPAIAWARRKVARLLGRRS